MNRFRFLDNFRLTHVILRTPLLILLITSLIISIACSISGQPTADVASASPGNTPSLPATELSSPTAPPPPTPTPAPLPPTVIEADPPLGAEIPLAGAITLYFNQPMERVSVESAIRGQPGLSGKFTWTDDATLTFTPDQPFLPETDLTFTITEDARAQNGLAMLAPISLSYRTVGYLRLTQHIPEAGTLEVDPTSAIIAAFNRPVAPLGADQTTLPAAFTLEPGVTGNGEWVNTSTYIFYPDPGLAGGTSYTVRINSSLHGTDGAPLETADQPKEWSFTTALPQLLSTNPVSGAGGVRLNHAVTLTFNQSMDAASVQATFALLDPNWQPVAGLFGWNADFSTLTFTPTILMVRDSLYTIYLGAEAQGRGGTPIGEVPPATFTTAAVQRIWNTSIDNGSITINLTAPLGTQDPLQYINFYPPVGNLYAYENPDYQSTNNQSATILRIFGSFAPESDYMLTISPDLPDSWGSILDQEYTFSFRTPPLAPSLVIPLAYETLFLTPQDAGLPAQVTNLNSVGLTVSAVPLNDFMAMLGPGGYDLKNNYYPQDAQTWLQEFNIKSNHSTPVEIPLTPGGSAPAAGLYHVHFLFSQPGLYMAPYLLVVSNIQMTFKISAADALVWAWDLRSNAPVANVPLTIYSEDGTPLASGQTDAEGIFHATLTSQTDPYSMRYAVLGQPGDGAFGMALSSWDIGIGPWDFGFASDFSNPRLKTYIYTDRPIYRPGQTVYFRAIVRHSANGRYTLPNETTADASSALDFRIFDDVGAEILNSNLPLSSLGSAHGEFAIPSGAQPGYYRIEVGEDSLYFQVANYRKPEINLQVAFSAEEALTSETLRATVNARYFFDAPASNIKIHWTLSRQPSNFYLPDYQVGVEDDTWLEAFNFGGMGGFFGIYVAEGEGSTGPDGTLIIEIPPDLENLPSVRQRYTLEVTATDESGLPVSARSGININPAEYYIGIHPDVWSAPAGIDLGFNVQTVDWQGQPSGNRSLHAEYRKVTWERQDSGDPMVAPTFVPQYTPVASVDFATGTDGLARLMFNPPEAGVYQLEVSGNGAITQISQWIGGPGRTVWPDIPNNRLRLTADRTQYRPGDTAQVFIPNPFGEDAYALITVERGVVLRHQIILLSGSGSTLSFPLSADDAPNVFVSVTLVGRDASDHADFRQGLVNLPVEPVEQTLQVSVTADPPNAGPGDTVTFKVHVTDANSKPVQGEFSFSVVDLAVLALADPNAPDILPAYYGQQPLGVRTAVALAAYARRFAYIPGGRGGGGGDETPSVARENFPDTAYWQPDLVTDANGDALVIVTLPDNLTTWQIDVRGITADSRVGQAQIQVVTSQDLMVRPVTPRFFVAGDHALLSAIVQNNTIADLQSEVSLQASGFSLDDAGSATQTASIPAGGRVRLEWWGTAQSTETAEMTFSASAGDYTDAIRLTLPIRNYLAPQAFASAGALFEGGERLELVSLPVTFDPLGGNLRLELASSLTSASLQALDILEHYPYECTEQTLSRFLPNLETYRVLQAAGVQSPDLQARLDRTLDTGLQRLLASQNYAGGWSWWSTPRTDEYGNAISDPYITAYVLFGLSRASQAGVAVNPQAIQKAVDYLLGGFTNPSENTDPGELDRLAFEHFALAVAGSGDLAGAMALYDYRSQLSPWAQALLALTIEQLSPGNPNAATLLSDLQATAVRTATGVHWESPTGHISNQRNLGSSLTTSAVVLYALVQRAPTSTLIPDAMRYLMAHRGAEGAWGSTYETAWSLMAMAEYIQATQELSGNYNFSAVLNGQPIASGQASPVVPPIEINIPLSSLYTEAPNGLIIQREVGTGALYYTVILNVSQPVEAVRPLSRGINLSREYFVGRDQLTSTSAPIGENLTVRLTLTLPNDVYYLVVEDYIPAGAEILDTSLKTSQQQFGEPSRLYDPRDPFAAGWGWWYFSPARIYDDHIAWAADYLPAGTYELTYTLVPLQAGQYRLLPARAWQFYFPEVQGTSAGTIFEIRP